MWAQPLGEHGCSPQASGRWQQRGRQDFCACSFCQQVLAGVFGASLGEAPQMLPKLDRREREATVSAFDVNAATGA